MKNMSFKEACRKAKGKCKSTFPIDAVKGEGREPADEEGFRAKKPGKKSGFAEAAKNAKKKKSNK